MRCVWNRLKAVWQVIRRSKNGTTGSSTTPHSGRAKSRSIAGSFRRFASTAKPPAAWSPSSRRIPIAFAASKGNPEHPGSRGRNCAKGPATLNQVTDPERIRYPLKRVGKRGEGKWERVSWDEVLDDIAGRVRKALQEDRRNEIMYHVGRPGHELLYHQRIFHAWGIDGHNSHTNVCSAGARAGYAFWSGIDRPSPDHANARFMLLLSSHLETGHYFNPHAQRIIEGKERGAKICVIDTRLSNTASKADYWISSWPGSEAAISARHVQCDFAEGSFRSRVRAPMGQLGRVSARRISPTSAQTFQSFHRDPERDLRAVHAGVRRQRSRHRAYGNRRSRPRNRQGRFGVFFSCLAQHGGGKSRRLAGGAGAAISRRAGWRGRNAGRYRAQCGEQIYSRRRR